MFWNWLRSFLQYSFYQLIAAAYVFVFRENSFKLFSALRMHQCRLRT